MLSEIISTEMDNLIQTFKNPTYILLLYLLIIWVVGNIFRKLGFPLMLGEMLAGLILGPPVLNIIQPNSHIEWLADLGIFFLIFFTGLEMDIKKLKETSGKAIIVALGGTLLPFATGYLLTRLFNGNHIQGLFIGMAISVTSIATKSRILKELDLLNSKVGSLMVNAALYDNIFTLILFTAITSLAKAGSIDFRSLVFLSLGVFQFFLFAFLIGYYLFPKLKGQFSKTKGRGFTFCLLVALIFGLMAELVNMHFVVGVFLAGIFLREDVMETTELYHSLFDTLYLISYGFLGPIFFITISFHVDLKVLFTELLPFLLLLTIGAILSKVIGAGLSAKLSGLTNKEALIAGFGMNGRGMMEIVLVVIGLELGVLDNGIVSMLIFIALVSTLMTPLALRLIVGRVD